MNCPGRAGEGLPPPASRGYSGAMPPRQIIKYAVDIVLVIAPLSGILYFLFDPDAFNTFLDWLMRVL
jgi:hypothetical protein